jgi:general secretion pathway protein A
MGNSMYENFFGLTCSPFQLSPDPFFLYSSERSKDALVSISDAVRERKGFVVLTGEVGTGKTLVLRCLVEMWEREETPFAYFIGPRLSTIDFLSYVTFELGIEVAEPTKGNLLRALYAFLLAQFEKGLTTVLIIDEAHQMPRSVLEEIRVLANFETAQQKLIQIVLVGQPELDKKLDSIELRSLKQRIAVRCRLEPLRGEEVRLYIERRLELAGAGESTTPIFPSEVTKQISHYSHGIPRLINSICDQALTAAYRRKVRVVTVEMIQEVATHFRLDSGHHLKQAEKALSFASHPDRSVPDKASQAVPVSSIPALKASAPVADSSDLKPAETAVAQTPTPVALPTSARSILRDVSPASEASPTVLRPAIAQIAPPPVATRSSLREGSTLSEATPMTLRLAIGQSVPPTPRQPVVRSERTLRGTWFLQLRRWFEPGLRLSMILMVAVIAPVSLATAMLIARHGKGSATTPNQVVGPRKTAPIAQTTQSGQPALVTPTARLEVRSVARIATAADVEPPRGDAEYLTSRRKVVPPALSRPLVKLTARPTTTEPPPIVAMQTRDLDIGKGLVATSPSAPKPLEPNPSGQVLQPKLLSSTQPVYPLAAHMINAHGTVVLDATVDETGKVTTTKVISGPDLLTQAATEALRTWKYEPATLNGLPVTAHVQVRFNFK